MLSASMKAPPAQPPGPINKVPVQAGRLQAGVNAATPGTHEVAPKASQLAAQPPAARIKTLPGFHQLIGVASCIVSVCAYAAVSTFSMRAVFDPRVRALSIFDLRLDAAIEADPFDLNSWDARLREAIQDVCQTLGDTGRREKIVGAVDVSTLVHRRARPSRSSNALWHSCLMRHAFGQRMPSGRRCRRDGWRWIECLRKRPACLLLSRIPQQLWAFTAAVCSKCSTLRFGV